MAKPETPKSAATIRAEQKADKARIDLLKRLIQDEKKARRGTTLLGAAGPAHSKKIREYEAELRILKSKKYG